MSSWILPLLAAGVTLFVMIDLLRRHLLREKYAVLWLTVSLSVVLIAVFPEVLATGARLTGVQTPSNLLFFVAALVLLIVCVQLSWEVSRLEDETPCSAPTRRYDRIYYRLADTLGTRTTATLGFAATRASASGLQSSWT